jgi:hypothetical protein
MNMALQGMYGAHLRDDLRDAGSIVPGICPDLALLCTLRFIRAADVLPFRGLLPLTRPTSPLDNNMCGRQAA